MRLTNDNTFVDSNVLLYLLGDGFKKAVAISLLKSNPVISIQVLTENTNVLFKKIKQLSPAQISQHIEILKYSCTVTPLSLSTIDYALKIKGKYGFQWFDCTIIASALLANCSTLFTEDMQHMQLIEGRLLIINPFLLTTP
jgi:predicted nucleic acid-binding protein